MDDSLLDEALADFESSSGAQPVSAADHEAKFPTVSTDAKAASTSGGSAAKPSTAGPEKAPAFDPLGKQQPRPKPSAATSSSPAFNPLGIGKGKKPAGSKPSATKAKAPPPQSSSTDQKGKQPAEKSSRSAPAASSSSGEGVIDADLARGVAQLMADLAEADMAASSAAKDSDKVSPHEREIASTLAALAAAVPSTRGPDSANGTRLEDQLGGGDADFSSLADSIMHQLLSKDVLYQPMKDIGAKYPAWLAAHRDKLQKEDLHRFELQYSYIRQICALYEDDPSNFGKLFSLIQEMQSCGQPPEEIVQDLAPGLAFGEDGLPQLPTGSGTNSCIIS